MASFNPLANVDDTTASSSPFVARYQKKEKRKVTVFNIKVFCITLSDKTPGIKNEFQKQTVSPNDPSDYTHIQKGVKAALATQKAKDSSNPPTQIEIIGRLSCSNFSRVLLPILAGKLFAFI